MSTTWTERVGAFAALAGVAAAISIPLTAFIRRPRVSLDTDKTGILTRLEGESGEFPWLRLLVANRRSRRAAQGTRVLVEHYTEIDSPAPPVSLAGPELGWPSAELPEGAGAVIFGGGSRPLDFGSLQQIGGAWNLDLGLAMHSKGIVIAGRRELLPPKPHGYTVGVLVGADDGAARRYDVDVNWDGKAPDPTSALASVELAVRDVTRRWWWPAWLPFGH